jgi:hypothetical protein
MATSERVAWNWCVRIAKTTQTSVLRTGSISVARASSTAFLVPESSSDRSCPGNVGSVG